MCTPGQRQARPQAHQLWDSAPAFVAAPELQAPRMLHKAPRATLGLSSGKVAPGAPAELTQGPPLSPGCSLNNQVGLI